MEGTLQTKNRGGSFLSALMLVAALTGGVLLLFSVHMTCRNRIARKWPLADGQIVSSRVRLLDAAMGPHGNSKIEKAGIRFTYQVNGRQFVSTNVSYARGIGGVNDRYYDPNFAVKYPEGMPVKVAYNPQDPSDAVIDISRDPYFVIAIGLALVLAYCGYRFYLRRGHLSGLLHSRPSGLPATGV